MYDYDIVYIKGNPSSGLEIQHTKMNESIKELLGLHTFKSIDSNISNKKFELPSAKIYIGFSRGSRYLKKLNNSVLKISIGGISGSGINTFTNFEDKILSGDISELSMNAHFLIQNSDKVEIKKLIDNFLYIST